MTSFLQSLLQPESIIEGVIYIINNISFTTEIGNKNQLISPFINELYIIQDADRLDAIGAIGFLFIFKYITIYNLSFKITNYYFYKLL